jgi:hypothetical protein
MDDLEFTSHARREMRRDSITAEQVNRVLRDADDTLDQDDGRTAFGRMLEDGRWITVVVEPDGQTVVTAWWDRRRSRRRRR